MASKTILNAKINEVKGEIPNITNLATSFTAVEKKPWCYLAIKLTITQELIKLKRNYWS